MGKSRLIECICEINAGAIPELLADFSEEYLQNYLENLMEINLRDMVIL